MNTCVYTCAETATVIPNQNAFGEFDGNIGSHPVVGGLARWRGLALACRQTRHCHLARARRCEPDRVRLAGERGAASPQRTALRRDGQGTHGPPLKAAPA